MKVLSPKNIKAKLAALPFTLDETYERTLLAIDSIDQAAALRALKWLVFSKRPMKLVEMEEVCILGCDPPYVNVNDRADVGSIANMLSSLVLVRAPDAQEWLNDGVSFTSGAISSISSEHWKPDATIRLAHFSVREYLAREHFTGSRGSTTSVLALSSQECEQDLALGCLRYLQYASGKPCCKFDRQRPETGYPSENVCPLVEYASANGARHQRAVETRMGAPYQKALSIFCSDGFLGCWTGRPRIIRITHSCDFSHLDGLRYGTLLYCASYLELPLWVEDLCEGGEPVHESLGKQGTALHMAALRGNLTIAKTLLQHGINVDSTHEYSGKGPPKTALQLACAEDHVDLVRYLIAVCSFGYISLLRPLSANRADCRGVRRQPATDFSYSCADTISSN